jgi:hypothetical protein
MSAEQERTREGSRGEKADDWAKECRKGWLELFEIFQWVRTFDLDVFW